MAERGDGGAAHSSDDPSASASRRVGLTRGCPILCGRDKLKLLPGTKDIAGQ
jgi:hypothetical protein